MVKPSMDVKNTSTSEGLDSSIKIQTTPNKDVDRATEQPLTEWDSPNWTKYYAYYNGHVSVNSVINRVGMWAMGEGHNADEKTKKITDKINGWGKDTFDEVLDNQIRVKHINGDSYAEIVTSDKKKIRKDASNLINLKPLNPASIIHEITSGGILTGYRQKQSDGSEKKLKLHQIFHLSMNRTADQIHGTGDIESLTTFLDKIKQIDEDMSVMFHRFVVPLIIWKLNTDDPVAIADFKKNEKNALNKGDNLMIPDKAVEWSLLEAGKGVGKIINPMEWRNKWTEEVIKGGGVPALIMAIESNTTEASSKMVVFAWGIVVDKEQKSLENQVRLQLNLKIKLPDTPKIDGAVAETQAKEGDKKAVDPNDTKAEMEGKQ